MLECPACARIYPDGTAVCPKDGVFLKPPQDALTGHRQGNYLFMGRLGKGGMGTVYRGEHVIIRKEVALKVLHRSLAHHPQILERFVMEARAASMIRHPNIVDVTDFGELPDGSPFFVMEFLDGPTLDQEISRKGPLPLYRTVNILTQVCRALHACHAEGLVHRDLKPENIVLQPRQGHRDLVLLPGEPTGSPRVRKEGQWDFVKILDFGVASIHRMTATLDEESRAKGIVFGSPYYVSPEQARGETGDYRSDLYSLGIIFFEMLTGEVPFDGETPQEIMRHHERDPAPLPSAVRPDLSIPPEVDHLVQRSLSKRPRDRHPSAEAFLEDLSTCFGDEVYGRDLDRFLHVQRRRTKTLGSGTGTQPTGLEPPSSPPPSSPPPTSPPPASPPPEVVTQELRDLFQGKYEPPRPVTRGTLEAIQRKPRKESDADAPPDPDALRAELAGLFPSEDE